MFQPVRVFVLNRPSELPRGGTHYDLRSVMIIILLSVNGEDTKFEIPRTIPCGELDKKSLGSGILKLASRLIFFISLPSSFISTLCTCRFERKSYGTVMCSEASTDSFQQAPKMTSFNSVSQVSACKTGSSNFIVA